MKRSYILFSMCCILFSSCEKDVVELPRDYLVQGNWEQYMVTEQYYDREGDLQDVMHKSHSEPVKISKDRVQWGNHNDSYQFDLKEDVASLSLNCKSLPIQNKIEGITGKHPDWMSWTSVVEEDVAYQVGNKTKLASKVKRSVEFRRVDVVR